MRETNIPNKILKWYDNNKRKLPWRKKTSTKNREYFTLVSEFMLQQTQVKTVIPYFENFIKKFPNLKSLAKASDQKILKNWEGLGYYSRASNLKKTAIELLKEKKSAKSNTRSKKTKKKSPAKKNSASKTKSSRSKTSASKLVKPKD